MSTTSQKSLKDNDVTEQNLVVGLCVTLKDACRKGTEKYYFRVLSIEGDDVHLKGFATSSGKVPVDKIWFRKPKKLFLYKCYETVDEKIVELLYGNIR